MVWLQIHPVRPPAQAKMWGERPREPKIIWQHGPPAVSAHQFNRSDTACSRKNGSADAGFPARRRPPAELPLGRNGFSPTGFSAAADNLAPSAKATAAC